MTEGIIDITPHLPAPEMSLEEALAIAAKMEQDNPN
jgi:hypothetical protein